MKVSIIFSIILAIAYAGCPVWQCSEYGAADSCWYVQKEGEQPQGQPQEVQEPPEPVPTKQQEPAEPAAQIIQAAVEAPEEVDPQKPKEEVKTPVATDNKTTTSTEGKKAEQAKTTQRLEVASTVRTSAGAGVFTDKDIVHVGPWCKEDNGLCYLSIFRDQPLQSKCAYKGAPTVSKKDKKLSAVLYARFCSDVDFPGAFNCARYCSVEHEGVDIYSYELKHCNITSLKQEKPEHNFYRNKDWGHCREDGDCASNQCDCVPSQTGQGRCTVSVHDKFYEQTFQTICDEGKTKDEFRMDKEEDTCALWILLKIGHFIAAVQDYDTQLPCLQKFNDRDALVSLKDHLDEPFKGQFILGPIAIVVTILLCCYCCWKRKAEKELEQELLKNQADGKDQEYS